MNLRETNSRLKKLLCVITGPTACGKTDITIELAKYYNTHILSADSRQFYRQLVIGAAMPSLAQLQMVPHHFIGHLSVEEYYNVYKFEQDALALCSQLFEAHQVIFLTGGSGLYIDAVSKGIDILPDPDPKLRDSLNLMYENEGLAPLHEKLKKLDSDYFEQVDQSNPVRLIRAIEVCLLTGEKYSQLRNQAHDNRPFNVLKIVLDRPKDELHQRIHLRTDLMIKEGLVDEAKSLTPFRSLNALNTVGYKEIFQYLDGDITLDKAVENIKTNTRRYAKRQLTWFRRDPDYHWINANNINEILSLINSKIL